MTLVGTKKTEQERILGELDRMPVAFYLTGSRRFGTPQSNSDYDFFVHVDSLTQADHLFLQNLGFFPDSATDYHDSSCIQVLRHISGVDIQVRSDADVTEKICMWLDNNKSAQQLVTKANPMRARTWDMLYSLFYDNILPKCFYECCRND